MYVQATCLRGVWPKAIAVVLTRLSYLPVHPEGHHLTLPHETISITPEGIRSDDGLYDAFLTATCRRRSHTRRGAADP